MSPIVVDPTYTPPPPAQVVEAPDGILKVKLDEAHAGVLLRADVSGLSPVPQAVRFWRNGELVRSGDPAFAPGGIAHAYDHEAPIGEAASYWVQPVDPATLEATGAESDRVTVELANPRTVRDLWVKNPGRPDLSLRVWVEDPPELSRAANNTFSRVPGSMLGVASWDRRSGYETTLTVVTDSAAESEALEALLDSGILLVQTRSDYDFPALYCLPGDITETRVSRMSNMTRRWTVSLTQTRRPATVDTPLRIPGLSWASLAAQYPTWAELAAQVPSWDELIWGAV